MVNTVKTGYFHRVARELQTDLWVNNATAEQAKAAIEVGAVSASTNPTYPSKLPADYLNSLIDSVLEKSHDDDQVAEEVYRQAVRHLQNVFMDLYEQSQGLQGLVAIQGDPRVNTDKEAVLEGGVEYFEVMAKNIIVKVPSTPAGAYAMEELTAMGRPTIATLGFSVDQAVYMAKAYERGLQRLKGKSDQRPVCYIVYIAGILEDSLKKQNEEKGNPVPLDLIEQAGNTVHRVVYHIFQDRHFKARLIGGGARGLHHFTGQIGGDQAITIGWDMIDTLYKQNQPVISHMDDKTPDDIIATLDKYLPDFGKSLWEYSLSPEEFITYPPVMLFQNAFLKGVNTLLAAIAERKNPSNK